MHKRIGILGGMSPESTVAYYQYITAEYLRRYGDHNYPEIVIYSVSFQPYIDWPRAGKWDSVAAGLVAGARCLEAAGVDFVLIATNTMHLVQDQVRDGISVPLLSMLDVVGDAIEAQGMSKVGLLGTRFVMESSLYQDVLVPRGIEVLAPESRERCFVNRVIYDELVAGVSSDNSRSGFVEVVDGLQTMGAEGIVLGCTEIPLLIGEQDVDLPLFDTTTLHAEAALNAAVR